MDLRNVRLRLYDLVSILIEKKYYFDLDINEEVIKIISKDRGAPVIGHVVFSDPPARCKNVFLPIFKLEEIMACLGVKPDDFFEFQLL